MGALSSSAASLRAAAAAAASILGGGGAMVVMGQKAGASMFSASTAASPPRMFSASTDAFSISFCSSFSWARSSAAASGSLTRTSESHASNAARALAALAADFSSASATGESSAKPGERLCLWPGVLSLGRSEKKGSRAGVDSELET